ncbi:MAG: adaptor protein MecA [Lachnospiraceae bacterium]|nr:adaptor protein MecA [Lachnospiraceae bacterium]
MKIEKINENQIRCTLTREDLEQRQIKLSELAYGTPKAKSLFKEMMHWASYKFGFEAEDIPLMIEAIPVSSESIVLIVTKVPYPEELDPRFSRFSEGDAVTSLDDDYYDEDSDFDEEDFELAPPPKAAMPKVTYENTANDIVKIYDSKDDEHTEKQIKKIYRFRSLEDVIRLSKVVDESYKGSNSLLKTPEGEYDLIVENGNTSPKEFNRLSNILSEYGSALKDITGSEAHIREFYTLILKDNAISALSQL